MFPKLLAVIPENRGWEGGCNFSLGGAFTPEAAFGNSRLVLNTAGQAEKAEENVSGLYSALLLEL